MIMWHVTLLPPDAILGSKCTQNAFAAPDPAGGAYSTPPDSLVVFDGKGGEGREMDPRNFENRSTPMFTTNALVA